jgi:hypothetical protein
MNGTIIQKLPFHFYTEIMKFTQPSFARGALILVVGLLSLTMLTACAKSTTASVSIHGVNYTEEVFSYSVEDPADKNNQGGGELIDPYAAGGTMCCYALPKKWRPGIKLQINTTRWLPKKPDGNMLEVHEQHVVEVPSYVDGKPGELWVIRNADATVDVVSSDYQPDHENWPGKVKGWPVPSLAYQRERWDLYIHLAESDMSAAQQLKAEFEQSPDKRAAESWNFEMNGNADGTYRGNPKSLAGYSGPTDPKYRLKLRQEDIEWLEESQRKLIELRRTRP